MSAPPARRTPPPRPGERRHATAPARVVALVAVAGLLLVGVVSLLLILRAARGDEDNAPVVVATATPTPKPTATPKPRPTPVPLTAEQKAERKVAADVVA